MFYALSVLQSIILSITQKFGLEDVPILGSKVLNRVFYPFGVLKSGTYTYQFGLIFIT
jgi:hypothetical protein